MHLTVDHRWDLMNSSEKTWHFAPVYGRHAVSAAGNASPPAAKHPPLFSSASSVETEVAYSRNCMEFDFLIEAIFIGVLCLFGFSGNSMSLAALRRHRCKSATPLLLMALAVADTVFLIFVIPIRVITSVYMYVGQLDTLQFILPYVGAYVFPLALIAETNTIWLTMLVTLNRYISVCKPQHIPRACSRDTAQRQLFFVVFCTVLYNIPRFFEFKVLPKVVGNVTILHTTLSPIGENKAYQIIYGNILYFLLMYIIPLILLLYTNCRLIHVLHHTRRKRSQMLRRMSTKRQEDDITLMLIGVVVVFVVCQTPALITQILTTILDEKTRDCPYFFYYYSRISDLMVVLNSSINFIVYCFCSRKFRRILIIMIYGKSPSVREKEKREKQAVKRRKKKRQHRSFREHVQSNGGCSAAPLQVVITEPEPKTPSGFDLLWNKFQYVHLLLRCAGFMASRNTLSLELHNLECSPTLQRPYIFQSQPLYACKFSISTLRSLPWTYRSYLTYKQSLCALKYFS